MIRNTSSDHAPWVVVPADNKWFTRLLVVETIVDALWGMDLEYPKLDKAQMAELKTARKELEKE
jgi:Polyphosphate kinase 2 (PPK2)